MVDMILIIKEVLFWWMLIYGILLIFSQTVRIEFIRWLESLNKPKHYSLKAEFNLDTEYSDDIQKELEDKIIVEIKKEIDNG